jgi:hypothetical protein
MGMLKRREEEAATAPDTKPEVGQQMQQLQDKPQPLRTAAPLDLKSRQIQAQGCWQAAASNPGLIGYAADIEAFKEVVRTLAEDGLKFIQEKTQ